MAKKEMTADEIIAANLANVGQQTEQQTEPEPDALVDVAIAEAEEAGRVVADDPPATPPAPPNPWDVLDRLTRAIEAISARPAEEQSGKALEVLTTAVMRLADASIEGSKIVAEGQIKAVRPSNQVIPEISVFNRRGRDPKAEGMDPKLHAMTLKPKLKCDMFFPWILEWESLTTEEVQLLNLLEEGSYVVKLQDRTKVTMVVQIQYNEANTKPSRLFVNHETAFNQNNYRNFPPMTEALRQMLKQHDRPITQQAAAVLMDEEMEALIEAGQITVTQ